MAAPVYSMTGFASATRELSGGSLSLDIRTVNHRYLELQFRVPDSLRTLEPALRERIGGALKRGKVECRVDWRQPEQFSAASPLETSSLEQLRATSAIVQEVFPDAIPLSVNEILHWPGVFRENSVSPSSLETDCLALADEALAGLAAARNREGDKLKSFLLERVDQVCAIAATLSPKIPELVAAFQEKLSSRLREALGSHDEERVHQEVVMFAAKVDVEEELSRLKAHGEEVRHVLQTGGPVGKRLDFLMQELNREANTLGSKSASTEVTKAAMELKILIEQMREQIQNLE